MAEENRSYKKEAIKQRISDRLKGAPLRGGTLPIDRIRQAALRRGLPKLPKV